MEIKLDEEDKKKLFDTVMVFINENPMSLNKASSRGNKSILERMYQDELTKQLKVIFENIVKQLFDGTFTEKLQDIGNKMVETFFALKTDAIVSSIIDALDIEAVRRY